MKKCVKCLQEKALTEFSRCKKSKDGVFSICKDCDVVRRRKYRRKLKPKDVHISDLQCAYLAGLLDGEGYIGMTRSRRKSGKYIGNYCYHARLVIGITAEQIFDIRDEYKIGRIYKSKARKKSHKDRLDWTITSHEIRGLLPKLLPFLKIKVKQAQLLLEYLQIAYNERSRDDIYRKKVAGIYVQLRMLNRRGCADTMN